MIQKNKGITLIALVVTIVVLLILAGITISLVFSNNGIISKAREAVEKTNQAVINEQAQINELADAMENMLNGITGSISPEEPLPEGAVQFSTVEWDNGRASTIITTSEEGYTLQYQIGGIAEESWIDTTSGYEIRELTLGQIVYGRLYNGTNGSKTSNITIDDIEKPQDAEINLSETNINTGGNVTAEITLKDNESGVNTTASKWVYNTNSTEIGADESLYTGSFSENPQTITLSATTAGTYYLHVLTVDNAGNVTETVSKSVTVFDKKIEDLKAGEYVNYIDNNNNTIKCVVLYDKSFNYGVQIISADSVEDVSIGKDGDFEGNRTAYNNAIVTLNSKANEYLNTKYASSARCVGSLPDNPTYESNQYFVSSESYMNNYNNTFKDQDTNYTIDNNQMKNLGINLLDKEYWLASRGIISSSESTGFYLKAVESTGPLCWIAGSDGKGFAFPFTYGFRPVITLKDNIKITNGKGTLEEPYNLSV